MYRGRSSFIVAELIYRNGFIWVSILEGMRSVKCLNGRGALYVYKNQRNAKQKKKKEVWPMLLSPCCFFFFFLENSSITGAHFWFLIFWFFYCNLCSLTHHFSDLFSFCLIPFISHFPFLTLTLILLFSFLPLLSPSLLLSLHAVLRFSITSLIAHSVVTRAH